jgi:hypothetical protein
LAREREHFFTERKVKEGMGHVQSLFPQEAQKSEAPEGCAFPAQLEGTSRAQPI